MIHDFLWLICNFICIVLADRQGNSIHHIFEEEQYEIKYCASEDLAEHEKGTCRFYTMIIDAGSTGTRLEIFEFSHNPSNPSIPFKLQKELFVERNPGLSSYSSVPKDAAAVVADLMEEAKLAIPKCLWKHSPVALRATAGFRLLPEETVKIILQEIMSLMICILDCIFFNSWHYMCFCKCCSALQIETVLRDSPFLTGEDPATVLDGTDEGIFGWFTLNYLLDRLESSMQESNAQRSTISEKLSAAAFDLGGGSTQVTFILRGSEEQYPSSFIKEITLFSKKVKLYSHSYLGNGIMASRLNILRMSGKSTGTVISPCIAVADDLNWKFQETNYRILYGSSEYGFDNCYKNVRKHVYLSSIHDAGRFILGDLYAFGYFYNHALRIGIISTQGGNVTAAQFMVAAKKACSRTEKFKNDSWKPWQCLDLTYIYSLLVDGYGIAADRNITIVKKLRGMEMSWALGAAHHLINTFHESKSRNNTIIENYLNERISEQLTQACTNYWSEFQTYLLSCFYNLMSLFDLFE
ncbi:Nucleoside-diphosphatase uda-1 [Trichinella britovi]|uniref:Nucleoside-diphosphatase uda-1 n=1 Tax=Trichinella britovi TaxID=45882 RepID=A0A0V1DCY7_TRIBR|nr:Nucleoside-diphosphatase uda-1 [Trichinella britovi]